MSEDGFDGAPPEERDTFTQHQKEREAKPDIVGAYREFSRALTTRMTTVNEEWKEEHGFAGNTWDEIEARTDAETQALLDTLAPGVIDFDTTWQTGNILQGQEFRLKYAQIPAGLDETEWGEDFVKTLEGRTKEERYASDPRTIFLSTRIPGKDREEWAIHLTPDSPPYAVNLDDSKYLNLDPENAKSAKPIRETFGDDAAPLLSESEMRQLTRAILTTPATVGEVHN